MKTNKRIRALAALFFLATIPVIAGGQPRFYLRREVGPPPVDRYFVSLARSYDVPYEDICLMHDAGVRDEDIPTILYIYTHSQYSLRQIYSLRLRGATWEQLSSWCGVPLGRVRGGPPYGNAYGYYRHGPGKAYSRPGLSDGDREGPHGTWSNGEHGRDLLREDR